MKSRRTPFAMVPLWVYDHPDVTPTVMQVYLGVAALCAEGRWEYTVEDLILRTGLKKSAVYAAVKTLIRINALTRAEVA